MNATLIVVYAGDISRKLKACGTKCPYKLNVNGNIELSVVVRRGGAAAGLSDEEFMKSAEPFVLSESRKNGRVISWRWEIDGAV